MLNKIADKLKDKQRILLLQGPMSPFFWQLAKQLKKQNKQVFKINFNGGDCLFYPTGATHYRGDLASWQDFLNDAFVEKHCIDCILLYGDCRSIHLPVRQLSEETGVEFGVFEEGYIRPNYITFEFGGVNGLSTVPKNPEFYQQINPIEFNDINAKEIKVAFCKVVTCVFSYYLFAIVAKPYFRHYQHHRPLNVMECFYALRGYWRKLHYKIKERGIQKKLTEKHHQQFFIVPLQVYNDSQVVFHSHYDSIEAFIEEVITSFANYAPNDKLLVLKHHPRDRGWKNYSHLIKALSNRYNIYSRVYYIHDQHLPHLLKAAVGCVTINSTVGLSALYHGCPVKTCGIAVYDAIAENHKQPMQIFFREENHCDYELYKKFTAHIIRESQFLGAYY